MGFIKKLLRYKLQKDFGGIYVPDVKSRIKKIKLYTYLILSISGIVLLCLSATGETDMSGKQISIFSLIFQAQQANTDISNLH